MIATKNKAQSVQKIINQQLLTPDRKRISARWEKVNGQLICHWVTL